MTTTTTTGTTGLAPERLVRIRLEVRAEHLLDALEFYTSEAARITTEVSPSVDPIRWGEGQGMAAVVQTIREDVGALVEALAVKNSES